ncbi:hypothetical protein WA158_001752 [Blastocystis sp. Blastoise]
MSVRKIILEELSDVLNGDVSDDIINYILSMTSNDDMMSYFEGLLGDKSEAQRITDRINKARGIIVSPVKTPDKVTPRVRRNQLRKNDSSDMSTAPVLKQAQNKENLTKNKRIMRKEAKTLSINEDSKKETEKQPVEEKEEDQYICGCQATKHELLYNCVYCGYILCELEKNPDETKQKCPYCKRLINNNYILDTDEYKKAEQNKDKLLNYDQNQVARSKVYDDQNDYFSKDVYSDTWATEEDRTRAATRDEERRKHQQTFGANKDAYLNLASLINERNANSCGDENSYINDSIDGIPKQIYDKIKQLEKEEQKKKLSS